MPLPFPETEKTRVISPTSPAMSVTLPGREFRHLRTAGELDTAAAALSLPALSGLVPETVGRFFYAIVENDRTVGIAELVEDGAGFAVVDAIAEDGRDAGILAAASQALADRLAELQVPRNAGFRP